MAQRNRSKGRKSASATSKARITKRFVDTKRHTIGYLVGGRRQTVAQTTRMARQGRIQGVRVVGRHIQAAIGARPLSSLPTAVS